MASICINRVVLVLLVSCSLQLLVPGSSLKLLDLKALEAKTSNFMRAVGLKLGVDPEADMNFCEISNYHGYNCEEYRHEIVTEDGFLLTLHRINGRLGENVTQSRPPVFVQHGLLCDSTSWILNLNNESIPFILSDAGFDVWVGNSRGNTYSKMHKTLKPDQQAFWNWSWAEMAEFDLPASLDFVTQKTGHDKMHYVGHSQGTLIAFTHLSKTPNSKIKHLLALGPVFKVKYIKSPLKYLAPYTKEVAFIVKLLGVKDFLPSNELIHWLADHVCSETDLDIICSNVLFLICGYDQQQLNETRIPVYVSHTPAGTSVRNMVHFAQMVNSGQCSKYDYGSPEANKRHYGQPSPPTYNVTAVNVPVSLFWAENDWLADPTDVQFIIKNVKTLKNSIRIPKWDHLDFIWGLDTKPVLADRLVEIINSDLN